MSHNNTSPTFYKKNIIDIINTNSIYYPPDMENCINFSYEDLPQGIACRRYSSPIPVLFDVKVLQFEDEMAIENEVMDIKAMEMLSLMTGTPTEVLMKQRIENESDFEDFTNKIDDSYEKDSVSKFTNSISCSAPVRGSIVHQTNCSSDRMKAQCRNPVKKQLESRGYHESKRNDSEDELLFDMEL